MSAHPLLRPGGLKLGLFAQNADGGMAITTAPERWGASWADTLAAARMAEEGGLDFLLPIARWKGFGGETNPREHSFETLTWAAALAAATSRIALFATVHVPLVHPVFAAKALATVDHVSGGRAGLNIVCGWSPGEFAMFGQTPDAKGYDRAAEWLEIVERAWSDEAPFDFEGAYYSLKGVISRPASLQRPRPLVMNAAFSPPGRDFAARSCDVLFSTFTDLADGAGHVADMAARAAERGRSVPVFAVAHVVCRATRAEAEDDYDRFTRRQTDDAALDAYMAGKKAHSGSHDERAYALHRARFAGGGGTFPIVGDPDGVAETLGAIAAQGYRGVGLSFVNYAAETPFFCAEVLPRLAAMGLR